MGGAEMEEWGEGEGGRDPWCEGEASYTLGYKSYLGAYGRALRGSPGLGRRPGWAWGWGGPFHSWRQGWYS